MKKKSFLIFLIPLLAAALFTLPFFGDNRQKENSRNTYLQGVELFQTEGMSQEVSSLLTEAAKEKGAAVLFRGLDSWFYDWLLRIRPGIKEDPRLLILEVDDPSIAAIGMYPLSRNIFADGLILMKEFAPRQAVLDIEFVDPSPLGINGDLSELSYQFEGTFADLEARQSALFESLIEGRLSEQQARLRLDKLTGQARSGGEQLWAEVHRLTRDNDAYLGEALAYFDQVIATVNLRDHHDPDLSADVRDYVRENFALELEDSPKKGTFSTAVDIFPSILPVLSASSFAGFPRVYIDPDGTRRRVDLLYAQGDNYYGQLGFAAWWQLQGRPLLEVRKNQIITGGRTIPLTQDGRFLIPWPPRQFVDSFRHLSFLALYEHDRLWEDLLYNLKLMEEQGISSPADPLSSFYHQLESYRSSMIAAGDSQGVEEYRRGRDAFLLELTDYLRAEREKEILGEIRAQKSTETSRADQAYLEDLEAFIQEVFPVQRELLSDLISLRGQLDKALKGSLVIMGYTGTSTTDIGVNPFEKGYMNVGLYAAVINGLIQGEFLRELPWFYSGLAALLAALLTAGALWVFPANRGIALSLFLFFLSLGGLGAVFVFTGIYIFLLPVFLAGLTTFLTVVIKNFLRESREKRFIRGALSKVLAPEVVSEIENDPSLLNRAGESRMITAMFTDIAGFSSISEHLDAQELFQLLKIYLTAMNRIIFEELGVIDKFEGDAIIAFWGAPLIREDHAFRACRTALRMKAREEQLNKELLEKGMIKTPLHTRIGINTGVISVGFLGSDQRSDYTGMGNHMNLASRLEGVNKRYGTSICISHMTEKPVHASFITRKLDTVQVMNIEEPVILHELTCFKKDFTPSMREGLNYYSQGIHVMKSQNWNRAVGFFKEALTHIPGDKPSQVMLNQCKEYQKKPPPPHWDGVYKMMNK